jgi:DNA-binding beta-propeller fold protein YncE
VTKSTGIISTVAGSGLEGYSGDGGSATLSLLHNLRGVALDASGNIYIADAGHNHVRMFALSANTRSASTPLRIDTPDPSVLSSLSAVLKSSALYAKKLLDVMVFA